jgi:hypothetical protein
MMKRPRCIWLALGWMTCAALSLQAEELPAPQLLAPRDRMEMTDIAAHFLWTPVPGCDRYEIQIARDPDFKDLYATRRTKDVRYHEQRFLPKDVPPAGSYHWRVRATPEGREGPWSAAFRVSVNANHPISDTIVQPIGPENPVFLMRNRAWDPVKSQGNLREIIPAGLERTIVPDDIFIGLATEEALARARAYEKLGVNFVVWNNRARVPLAWLEYLFQNFPHCIGTAEGEHFWSWYWERGPEGNVSEWDYVPRAWALCAKYGRYYFIGDGEAVTYKWTQISQQYAREIRQYRKTLVPMFKSTIGHVALHSIGAVEGLMAAGWVENSGFWADEFVWGECGFGKTGEILPKPDATDRQCPYSYDLQMWLMGIAAGSTVFHLESAHQWTADGRGEANYRRYYLPFVSAVVRRGLIPSRQAFLESLTLAVACDPARALVKHGNKYDNGFGFLNELYALKRTPFQEIIPDTSRYGIVALLPPGAECLNRKTQVIPQEQLLAPGKAAELFNRAYPERFQGEAFQWECDGTVLVTNSRENEECRQPFSMRLKRGPVARIGGAVEIHQVLVGKIAKDGLSLWLHANFGFESHATRNVPNPDRVLRLELDCASEPQVAVTPPAAKVEGTWDPVAKHYALALSMKDGPAECEIRR